MVEKHKRNKQLLELNLITTWKTLNALSPEIIQIQKLTHIQNDSEGITKKKKKK